MITGTDVQETLSALGMAGIYCSQPEEFIRFEGWLREKGYVDPGDKVSRDLLRQGCLSLAGLLTEVEAELSLNDR